jgi:hypothetical protein
MVTGYVCACAEEYNDNKYSGTCIFKNGIQYKYRIKYNLYTW